MGVQKRTSRVYVIVVKRKFGNEKWSAWAEVKDERRAVHHYNNALKADLDVKMIIREPTI